LRSFERRGAVLSVLFAAKRRRTLRLTEITVAGPEGRPQQIAVESLCNTTYFWAFDHFPQHLATGSL